MEQPLYIVVKLLKKTEINEKSLGTRIKHWDSKRACRGRQALLEKVFCYLWGANIWTSLSFILRHSALFIRDCQRFCISSIFIYYMHQFVH